MKYILSLSILFLFSCAHNPISRDEISTFSKLPLTDQLKPFVSDGCSKWPNGTKEKPDAWLKCCFDHDIAYWLGGTLKQRDESDNVLKACVTESFSNTVAILMYLGVKIGGSPSYNSNYKWGFGWSYDRGYLAITEEELRYSRTISPSEGEPMEKYLEIPQ